MYTTYQHLLGLPYTSGEQDCYGLARRYYKDVFDLDLLDIARPDLWWEHEGFNLITDFVEADSWESVGVNLRNLKVGDGLLFAFACSKINHVAVYVGNGLFIHHVYKQFSCETAVAQKWMSRCLGIVRHKKVTEALDKWSKEVNYLDTLKHAKSI